MMLNTRGEYIQQHRNVISTCIIGNLFAVLQFMQVINKQHNGINMNIRCISVIISKEHIYFYNCLPNVAWLVK